ncbi:alpha/beta hydrolase [Pseudoramibacter faecis]|uniref:alpha/beta hydrolase n=1 Tax=Pseudoramibacter faecis TaxID=3108534 RepID=UPI002E76B85C|nr:alpha/beta hydrolase [Pseudoramibacter sp. HA2172]
MFQTTTVLFSDTTFEKKATVYAPVGASPKAVLLYFHGGGLLYGERNDLPESHLHALTDAGYAIVAFDYPLAPSSKIDTILADVRASITCYLKQPEHFRLTALPYFLWGRSAGAYLVLLAAAHTHFKQNPAGILSYYGYGFFCDHWYCSPNAYYQNLPAVSSDCLLRLPETPHACGPMDSFYSAYVYARQSGTWKDLFFSGREKFFFLNYSLRTCDSLPAPLFAVHSTGDPDVPYAEFTALCERFLPSRFIATGDVHDFDRDTENPQTRLLLKATLKFLAKRLN